MGAKISTRADFLIIPPFEHEKRTEKAGGTIYYLPREMAALPPKGQAISWGKLLTILVRISTKRQVKR
jgi:hypothetical protein